MKIFILLITIIFVSGCASNMATMAIHSQPEGAYITENNNGLLKGISPVYANWNLAALARNRDNRGCYTVSGFTATWASGATTKTGDISLCPYVSPSLSFNYSINRDSKYPDLDKDLQLAVQIQGQQVQQQIQQQNQSNQSLLLYMLMRKK